MKSAVVTVLLLLITLAPIVAQDQKPKTWADLIFSSSLSEVQETLAKQGMSVRQIPGRTEDVRFTDWDQ